MTNFIERDPAFFDAVAGVGNAAVVENFLQLPVLAERSVNRNEGKTDIFRKLEVFVANIDINNLDVQ